MRYRFEPAGEGTDVTESVEVTKPLPSPVERVIDRVMGVSDRDADLAKGMGETLARIKAAAEA